MLRAKVSEYLHAVIPRLAPKRVKKDLELEYQSHIEDKIEHYREIGYSEEDAEKKAIEDMGAPENVREQFGRLYIDKAVYAILYFFAAGGVVFILMCLGVWYITADVGERPILFDVLLSSAYMFGTLLLLLYAKRRKKAKLLAAAGFFSIIHLATLFYTSVYQPFFYPFVLFLEYIFDIIAPDPNGIGFGNTVFHFITIYMPMFTVLFYAVFSFTASYRLKKPKINSAPPRKKRQIPLKYYAFMFAALTCLSCALYMIFESGFLS